MAEEGHIFLIIKHSWGFLVTKCTKYILLMNTNTHECSLWWNSFRKNIQYIVTLL